MLYGTIQPLFISQFHPMDTKNPITEKLQKKPAHSGFFDTPAQQQPQEVDDRESNTKESEFDFDLASIDLGDINFTNQDTPSDNQNHFDEEEDVGCGCVRLWSWLCPKA